VKATEGGHDGDEPRHLGSSRDNSSLPACNSESSTYPVVGDVEPKTSQDSPSVVLFIVKEPVAPKLRFDARKVGKLSRINDVPEISFCPVGSLVKPSPFSSPPPCLPKRLTGVAEPSSAKPAPVMEIPPGPV